MIRDSGGWLTLVPFWASWPFEVMLVPLSPAARLADLDDAARDGLAEGLRDLNLRYDALFRRPFPFSMGWHQAPFGGASTEHWQVHAHFFPPLLRATVRKFMVGYELLVRAAAGPDARGGGRPAARRAAAAWHGTTASPGGGYDGASPDRRHHAALGRSVRRRAGRADGGLHAVHRGRRGARARRHRGLDRARARPPPGGPRDGRGGGAPRARPRLPARRRGRGLGRLGSGPRGRPHEPRDDAHRARREHGRQAAHRAVAQRPGGHGPAALDAPGGRAAGRVDRRPRAGAGGPRGARGRRRPARHDAHPARPARAPRAPPPRLRRDAGA